ncbi:hypothetical protein [Algoriphagus limi]|uniref:Uncharacterized protein n=1 Tax=Algoriphagus limi TaxID=2975273 RepID=A0ABT2G0T1_9BACT|nr:hypothetical protein [Algoriphagus limi]MCS5488883.1 hypothetical protein [Algoriphagus limi]
MNKILVDQIKTVFPKVENQQKEGKLESLTISDYPLKGISIRINDRAITLDFSNFKSVDFKLIKLFFLDRLKYDKVAVYDYTNETLFNLYFQKKFYSQSKEFEEAMWRYGILKNVLNELEKFGEYLKEK